MRLLVSIYLVLTVFLTGCDRSAPLAKSERPDAIRVYSAGSQTGVTNKESIDRILSQFADPERKWKRYWITLPNPQLTVALERDRKSIASVFIGSDWVISSMAKSRPEAYSTAITNQEHEDLLRLLGAS